MEQRSRRQSEEAGPQAARTNPSRPPCPSAWEALRQPKNEAHPRPAHRANIPVAQDSAQAQGSAQAHCSAQAVQAHGSAQAQGSAQAKRSASARPGTEASSSLYRLLRGNFARSLFDAPALGARVAQPRDLSAHGLRQPAHVAQVPTPLLGPAFYLDDFAQSSKDPNPQPLQHTPRTTWQETPRPAPWQATARVRPPARTVCAARPTARRRSQPCRPSARSSLRTPPSTRARLPERARSRSRSRGCEGGSCPADNTEVWNGGHGS